MKVGRLVLAAVGLLLLSGAARAQTFGCRASVSCSGPRGFSTQMGVSMGTYPAFAVGMSYDQVGGFQARWNPPSLGSVPPPDTDAIDGAVDLFLDRFPGLKAKAEKKAVPPRKEPAPAKPEDAEKKDDVSPGTGDQPA